MNKELFFEEIIEIYSAAMSNITGAGVAGCESGGFGFGIEA